jgi:hypothetical protein
MRNLVTALRVGALTFGMAVLISACAAQLSDSDRALLDQAKTESQNATAAADRADQAAKRAEAAANQATDAASNAQMAMEKQSRMTQQSLRK